MERSLEIKAPVEKVWAFMTDWDRYPEWTKSVEKFEITSKQRSGVGMTSHEVGVLAGRGRYDIHSEATEFVENRIIAWCVVSGDKLVRKGTKVSWMMKPTKVGTQLTYSSDYEVPYSIFGKIIERLIFRGRFEKQLESWMENIKRLVEKGGKR
ncbi:MAG: SRPBCC family protein [Candidatus Bathyarchaeia archaeon]